MLYVPVSAASSGSATAAALAAFTPQVIQALLAGIGAALGIDPAGIFIVEIVSYASRRRQRRLGAASVAEEDGTDDPAHDSGTRGLAGRGLYLPPSQGTGVSVVTGIFAAAAASSPLVRAAAGGGSGFGSGGSGGTSAAEAAAIMNATVAVVMAQSANGGVAAAIAAQPAAVSGLNYSSPAQLVQQLVLDGVPAAVVAASPMPSSAGSAAPAA